MIYLASPYSDADPAVQEARFADACRQVAQMVKVGISAFSPIAYSHIIALQGLPVDWDFWRRFDLEFLDACSELWILTLPGWAESKGVKAEVEAAQQVGKPVLLVKLGETVAKELP